jgi:AcrR family transcriptional regulator
MKGEAPHPSVACRTDGGRVRNTAMSSSERTRRAGKADLRTQLIEVAARHFAQAGFEGASQRAVQREVGVNPATAHYYFGSKEALYRAVIETSLEGIQARRLQGLPDADATPGAEARFRAILWAYLSPHIEAATTEHGYHYARILAAIQFTTRGPATAIVNEAVNPVRQRYRESLYALFPDTPHDLINRALQMAVMLMASAPVQQRRALARADTLRTLITATVDFSAAGFCALCGRPRL